MEHRDQMLAAIINHESFFGSKRTPLNEMRAREGLPPTTLEEVMQRRIDILAKDLEERR